MTVKSATVHIVRFYKPEVRAINCLALEPQTQQLALSRSDNSLEIWNVAHNPYLQIFLPAVSYSSIEDLKWCGSRLISCGLQGTVVEYDLLNRTIKSSTTITGGVAWCLDYSPKNNLIAVGTEDGFINILTVTDETLEFLKFMDKQQGRVLCLSWDTTGQYLVTGSVDVVRVWNLATGHALHKMTTGRSQTLRETVVWSIAVTSDFTIITGDSRGFLTFWDGKLGTQIESIRSHEADILTLAVSSDEQSVVCAGVDPVIALYGRVKQSTGKRQWARGGLFRMHEHDVRAMVAGEDGRVFSGGVNGYLVVTGTSTGTGKKVRQKCPPLLPGPCVEFLRLQKQVLLRYLDKIELWALGQALTSAETADIDEPLPLAAKPTCLLRICAKPGESVISASACSQGRYIAYSTQKQLKFFHFEKETKTLSKIPTPSECASSSLIVFYTESTGKQQQQQQQKCITVTTDNRVDILDVSEDCLDETHSFRPAEVSSVTGSITHTVVSSCNSLLAIGDSCGHIAVWSTKEWKVKATLPNYAAPPTVLAFIPDSKTVLVAYSDRQVVGYDVKGQKYSADFKDSQLGVGVFHNAITGVLFDRRQQHRELHRDPVLFHDDSILLALPNEKVSDKPTSPKKQRKRDGKTEEISEQEVSTKKIHAVRKFQHIVAAGWLEKDEMAVVEVVPLALAETLPPALLKKKFGT